MVAESKKVQTLVNVVADQAATISDAVGKLLAIRVRFNSVNPDVRGTVLAGNLSALNTSLNAISTEINKQVWVDLINSRIPSHRNKALD